jgi:hypothetical protein
MPLKQRGRLRKIGVAGRREAKIERRTKVCQRRNDAGHRSRTSCDKRSQTRPIVSRLVRLVPSTLLKHSSIRRSARLADPQKLLWTACGSSRRLFPDLLANHH